MLSVGQLIATTIREDLFMSREFSLHDDGKNRSTTANENRLLLNVLREVFILRARGLAAVNPSVAALRILWL